MKQATLAEAESDLGALIARVRAGETIEITDGGRAVAQLVPPADEGHEGDEGHESVEARMERLERAGLIRRGSGVYPALRFEDLPEPVALSGVLDALLDERREGR